MPQPPEVPITTTVLKLRPQPRRSAAAQNARQPVVAYLSYSTGEFDARTFRMAESALDAGYRVVVYSRWHPGQLPREDRGDYELIRVPFDWRLGVPFLRNGARRRAAEAMAAAPSEAAAAAALMAEAAEAAAAEAEAEGTVGGMADPARDSGEEPTAGAAEREGPPTVDLDAARGTMTGAAAALPRPLRPAARFAAQAIRRVVFIARRIRHSPRLVLTIPGRLLRRVRRPFGHLWRQLVMFPLGPRAWAIALEDVAEPADIWHGMWAGSLPALVRLRARHGGRAIYDSRDIFMESRDWARLRKPIRATLQRLERRWAQRVDLVLTVNASYSKILSRLLGVPRPPVVMNCQPRWTLPDPPPNLIREALGLGPEVGIALYQGRLQSDRGIEQSMDAILQVPNAVLVLLGFGGWERRLSEQITVPPFAGKVHMLPAVPPEELVAWTASADVSVMAIQPSSLNHRWTTPQKLFESLAAGTPVVASDLPGMAEIVEPARAGVLVDPTDPSDIAIGIRAILDASPDERAAVRERVRQAAWDRYTWEAQVVTLLDLYRQLLGEDRAARLRPRPEPQERASPDREAPRPSQQAARSAIAVSGLQG